MFAWLFSRTFKIMALEAKLEIAEDRMGWIKERMADLENQRNALAIENEALMVKLQEADQMLQTLSARLGGGPAMTMPTQAREWKHVADATRARAELANLERMAGVAH